jgi:hypothetical protein
MPPALLDLVILQIGSHIYAQASLDIHSPIYTFWIAGMTDDCHHAQIFLAKMGL